MEASKMCMVLTILGFAVAGCQAVVYSNNPYYATPQCQYFREYFRQLKMQQLTLPGPPPADNANRFPAVINVLRVACAEDVNWQSTVIASQLGTGGISGVPVGYNPYGGVGVPYSPVPYAPIAYNPYPTIPYAPVSYNPYPTIPYAQVPYNPYPTIPYAPIAYPGVGYPGYGYSPYYPYAKK